MVQSCHDAQTTHAFGKARPQEKHAAEFMTRCLPARVIIWNRKTCFLCGVYIPPINSKYYNPEIFEELENDIFVNLEPLGKLSYWVT